MTKAEFTKQILIDAAAVRRQILAILLDFENMINTGTAASVGNLPISTNAATRAGFLNFLKRQCIELSDIYHSLGVACYNKQPNMIWTILTTLPPNHHPLVANILEKYPPEELPRGVK